MVTITVNGRERRLNIGCRTFISVIELMKILGVKREQSFTLSLNGEVVRWQHEPTVAVSSGDVVIISGIPAQAGPKA